jgi:hypothetical protein
MKWTDWIILAAAIATILVGVFEFIDHWSHVKGLASWVRRHLLRLKIDPTPETPLTVEPSGERTHEARYKPHSVRLRCLQ